jgi:hypothetical protein
MTDQAMSPLRRRMIEDMTIGFKLSSPRSLRRNGRWRGRRSVLTTAPGATADTMDTRPRHAGFAADPFWYHVLDSARAIVFEWRGATRAGIAILSACGTVRCRLCRGSPLASRRGVETGRPAGAADGGAGAAEGGAGGAAAAPDPLTSPSRRLTSRARGSCVRPNGASRHARIWACTQLSRQSRSMF